MHDTSDEFYTERLPDGRLAVFFRGKIPRTLRDRRRQARWDGKHYVTLSTRVPIQTARRFARACERDGVTVYGALKTFVEAGARRTQTTTRPPGTGGDWPTSSDNP